MDSKNSQTTPAITSATPVRQVLGAAGKRHIPPHPAQPQHTSHWAPRTRQRHQQEHRPQRPTESSDQTQHAKGRTGDCPGPRKETTTRRNVIQGGHPLQPHAYVGRSRPSKLGGGTRKGAPTLPPPSSLLIFQQPTSSRSIPIRVSFFCRMRSKCPRGPWAIRGSRTS